MDIQDSSCESNPFHWVSSSFNYDMRRVHSTPLMSKERQAGYRPSCLNVSGKTKKLFVSFRQEAEEDYEVRPALYCRSMRNVFNLQIPEPDCTVILCRKRFHCNSRLLQEYSLLFRRLLIEKNSDSPIALDSGNKIFPKSFWLIYQWMISRQNNEDMEFINLHWVAQLYLAANHLSIQELQDECHRYLTNREKLKEEKAFFVFKDLFKYDAKDLCDYLLSLIRGCFTALTGTQDFLDLDCEQVLQLLYSQYIVVAGEIEVFYAGVTWLLDDHIEEREVYIEEIMSAVRFHFLIPKQLFRISREFPDITGKSPVSLMIERAVRVAVLKEVDDGNDYIEKYLEHHSNPRNSEYKHPKEQTKSYGEFIHLSRRRREKNSRYYYKLDRLHFPKTRFVEEMENLYTAWNLNSST